MMSRKSLGFITIVALLSLALAAVPGMAQEQEREESGLKKMPATAAPGVAGLGTEDLTGPLTPDDLVYTLVGPGITVSNVTYTGADVAAGVFDGGSGIIGFEGGIILSSGDIQNVIGPNVLDGVGVNNSTPGDSDLTDLSGFPTYDAAVLEFDFVPQTSNIIFNYVFASDEYNEYVHTDYNDVFAFYVNDVNCAEINGDPVSINTVNNGNPYNTPPQNNPQYYINNDLDDGGGSINTEMDGLTIVLTCEAPVKANQTNHVKLAIADASDHVLDSNVFLKEGSFAPDCCAGANCPDDPELSKDCYPTAPPFYVVMNRQFEDLTRAGTGCQPIILNHPDCEDCCNLQDPACQAAEDDLQTRACPVLASRVDWSNSTGTEIVYQMCCGSSAACEGKWFYRIRLLQEDGTCPIDPDNSGCYDCLPPGTGIDLPAPFIIGGLAAIGAALLAAGVVVRRRELKTT
jgi:hypothetical protein